MCSKTDMFLDIIETSPLWPLSFSLSCRPLISTLFPNQLTQCMRPHHVTRCAYPVPNSGVLRVARLETSLAIQWLRLCAQNAQVRSLVRELILYAASKTQHSQIKQIF